MKIMEKKLYMAPVATRERMMAEHRLMAGSATGTDKGDVNVGQGDGGQGSTQPARSKPSTFSVWDD